MPKLFNENELEEHILSSLKNNNFNPITRETHFPETFLLFNQINLGSYGIIDIVTVDIHPILELPNNVTQIDITIIELKKGIIELPAIVQISKYRQGLYNYFEEERRFSIEINGFLVGDSINQEDGSCCVIDAMEWLQYFEYNISLDEGISFEGNNGWYKKDNNYNCLNKLVQQSKHIFLDLHKDYLREAYK